MPILVIKSGTTEIAGSTVKGSFSYFSGSTKDLGPTDTTGFYSGIDAPMGGYTVYQIGGPNGWTARVATDTTELNSILISYGAIGSTLDQRITWATNTNSVFINSGATPTYTIGQSALGGKIAYINGGGSTGTSGLVITDANVSNNAEWGCLGTLIAGTSTAFGTGAANTALIMAGCAQAGIAARLCGDLVQGGYDDWYLPSRDELVAICPNRAAIGGFQTRNYWTSSQSNFLNALVVNFSAAAACQFGPNNTNSNYSVRAIRSF